jgi:hypothetical protein
MTHPRRCGAVIAAWLLLPAGAAAADSFGPAAPVAGFGDQPALAQVDGAQMARTGAAAIAGTADDGDHRRAAVAFGDASTMAAARGVGPVYGAYDVAFAANATGDTALTYSVRNVAYLTLCRPGRCAPTMRVGTSALKPQSTVAVQPGSGRTIVMWRGHSSKGNRLQWRITTGGRLGRTHTLGEFGDDPRLATDASGKTVAVWLADHRARQTGVRTAARRVGEFLAPTTVTSAPAADLRLVTSDGGSSVAAWLTAPEGIDVEQPRGTIEVSTRTPSTPFSAPSALGTGSTLSLAGSPDGHAVLATTRHVAQFSVVVCAARRAPGAAFGPLVDLAPPQDVSDAYGPTAAAADGGRALVAWAAGINGASSPPTGVLASVAGPSGSFGAPELLAGAQDATLTQPVGAAITPDAAMVAWAGPNGVRVARAVR